MPEFDFGIEKIEPIALKALEFEETPILAIEPDKIRKSEELDKYITY